MFWYFKLSQLQPVSLFRLASVCFCFVHSLFKITSSFTSITRWSRLILYISCRSPAICNQRFIHSYCKCYFSTYHIPATLLGFIDTVIRKTRHGPFTDGTYNWLDGMDIHLFLSPYLTIIHPIPVWRSTGMSHKLNCMFTKWDLS